MEPFLVSTGLGALSEVGATTQLLALLMAARFRRPVPLLMGILVAAFVNHAVAGALCVSLADIFAPGALAGAIGVAFVGIAVWTLIPSDAGRPLASTNERFGVFGTTVFAFVLAETGDKSQIAAIALTAHYHQVLTVVAGSSLGMLIANFPAVLLGDRVEQALPASLFRALSALTFATLGVLTILRHV